VQQEFIKNSKFGKIYFKFFNNILVQIKYLASSTKLVSPDSNRTIKYILKYLREPGVDFKRIKVRLIGTDYQKSVWQETIKIPLGKTITYKVLADRIGSHPRPVAKALRHNPLPIIYPCHRVVSVSGIGGFVGATTGEMVNIKRKLLQHEGAIL